VRNLAVGSQNDLEESSAFEKNESLLVRTANLFEFTLLFMAIGVVIVSIAYALSRANKPGGIELYFAGEFIIALTPLILLHRNRAISDVVGIWTSITIGITSFVAVACYSPLSFAFVDEYQHSLTANSILATDHLFHVNPALAVSGQFPGLEIVTTGLSSLSGLSVFAAGTIIAGISHILMTGFVFVLARQFNLSSRTAVLAVVVFSTGYTYQAFLSYFAYETFAVPFLIATLIILVKMLKSQELTATKILGCLTIVLAFITIVSHHVTSYLLIVLVVILIGSAFFFAPRWRHRTSLIVLVLLPVLALILTWNLAVATDTLRYLSQIKSQLFGLGPQAIAIENPTKNFALNVLGTHANVINTPTPLKWLGELGVAVVVLVIPIGAWTVWRRRRSYPLYLWLMPLCAAIAYYALLPIFVFSPGGTGLVGRAQVLLLIPAGLVAAVGMSHGLMAPFGRHTGGVALHLRTYISLVLVSIVVIGAVPASYPGYASKLPTPYNVDAITRSVDRRTVAAGFWVSRFLGPKARIAADSTDDTILEATAGIPVIEYSANLFETTRFTDGNAQLVQEGKISYVFANSRLTHEIPANGSDFYHDPLTGLYAHPLPASSLQKFDRIAGVNRVFDDGTIVIYSLQGSRYYRTVGAK
jgi:hypothetical protein